MSVNDYIRLREVGHLLDLADVNLFYLLPISVTAGKYDTARNNLNKEAYMGHSSHN